MASYRYRKRRREAICKKMANWRAAKARKRIDNPPPEREPKMKMAYRFQLRVRDTLTGAVSNWHDLKSVRWASQAIGLVLRAGRA